MARGVSLHIGINGVDPAHYGWPGRLAGCEADAAAMRDLAAARGFTPHVLTTAAATRNAVTEHLTRFAGELVAGDLLLLTYAGHGGNIPDVSGDEPDGRDETWCLHDAQMIDDELFAMYARFAAGVRIVVVSDSCHSGTATKYFIAERSATRAAAFAGKRAMPRDLVDDVYRRNRAFYDGVADELAGRDTGGNCPAAVLSLAACRDDQLAADGDVNGLFTATLLDVWDRGAFRGDYRAFHQAIVDRMPPIQTPYFFRVGDPTDTLDRQSPFTI